MKLKDIKENFVKEFSSPVIFKRGYDYFKSGMVFELNYDPKDECITAEVSGNYGDYEVEITPIDKDDIDAYCSCPYDGYPCKHVVAVLLTFIHDRKQYINKSSQRKKEISSLEPGIKSLSKDELVKLVLSCAEKYPDFKRELMVFLNADSEATLDSILKDIDRVFPNVLSHYYSPYDTYKNLNTILNSIENVSNKIKVPVYWKVVDRVLGELNEYGMDDESLENIAINTMELLVKVLAQNQEFKEEKQKYIIELLKYYERRNCGINDFIYDTVYNLCSEKGDYQIVINKLEKQVQGKSFKSYYQDLLARLYSVIGDEESQLKILENGLEYGADYWRLAQYWVERQDDEKAFKIVNDGIEKGKGRKTELYGYLCVYFQKHKQYEKLYDMLLKKIRKNELDHLGIKIYKDSAYYCLWRHYEKQKDYSNQVKLIQLCLEHKQIDLEFYKTAKQTLKSDDWQVFDQEVIHSLKETIKIEKSKDRPFWYHSEIDEVKTLADIYYYKNEFDNLIEILQDSDDLWVKYEKKLMPKYPKEYLAKYKSIINKIINRRGRENYRIASDFAKKVKKILKDILKRPADWDNYISKLRADNITLRAMQNEFSRL